MKTTKDLKEEAERLSSIAKAARMDLDVLKEEARSAMARYEAAERAEVSARIAAREAEWEWKRSLPLTSLQRRVLENAQKNTVGKSNTAVELERLRYLRVAQTLGAVYYSITPEGRAKLAESEGGT